MNSSKKLAKNNGVGSVNTTTNKKGKAAFENRNKYLIIIGILAVLAGIFVVCYTQLRPRAILTVRGPAKDGKDVTNTVNMPEAMYDIYQAEAMPNMYAMYGMSFDWGDTTGDGDTYATAYKKSIMDGLKQREILYMCALRNNLTLTDEEKKTIQDEVKSARDNMTEKQKKMKGLDETTLTRVFEKKELGEKYKNSVIASLNIDEDALKKTVSKEDYRQYTLQYYTFAKKETDSSGESKDKDKATLDKALKDMTDLQKKAVKAEDFTKGLIETEENGNTDKSTGISYETRDLIETDTDFLDSKTLKKVKKMKNDEISDVLETEDGYYVIKMVNNNDPTAYDNQCQSVIQQEQENQFNTEYSKTISIQYATEVQSYWKGRVTIGGITYDDSAA